MTSSSQRPESHNKLGHGASTLSKDCDVSLFTNCAMHREDLHSGNAKRDSRSSDLLQKASSKSFHAEKKGCISVVRHATLPKPAILRRAFLPPISLHSSFHLSCISVHALLQLFGTAPNTVPPSPLPSTAVRVFWVCFCVHEKWWCSSLFRAKRQDLFTLNYTRPHCPQR